MLASVLVTLSLLVNGLGIAQAMVTKHDCCAGMMAHKMHGGSADQTGKPCPTTSSGCDDQCLMRCQATNVLPSFALALPAAQPSLPALPAPVADEVPIVDTGPGLRPPISA